MNFLWSLESQFTQERKSQSLKALKIDSIISILLIVISFIAIGYTLYNISDYGDWKIFSSALKTIRPFDIDGYFNPPMLAGTLLIYPFALFPYKIGGTLWNIFSLIAIGLCVIRLSKNNKLLRLALSFTLIPIVAYLDMGQICVLSVVGLTLVETYRNRYIRALGANLILFKPQVAGMAIFIYLKDSDLKEKIMFTAVFFLSFVIYGFWILDMYRSLTGDIQVSQANNISIFPYGIPIGVLLFIVGLKRNSYLLATVSTAFLSPYVNAYSLFPFMAYVFSKINIKLAVIIYLVIQFLYIYTY